MTDERWLIDLDGVVWLADQPIAGSADAIGRLREAGIATVFFTNNSFPKKTEILSRLERAGVPVAPGDLLTSPEAAALLCEPGERALVVGGEGIRDALIDRGVEVRGARDPGESGEGVDVVVVGIDPEFDYQTLTRATSAVRAGARLVATNDDATFPTPGGLIPGAGAMLAAVAVASGVTPKVAGKPHAASARLVAERIGAVSLVVGDRIATDGRFAGELRRPFALVMSGVTNGPGPFSPEPDEVADDLASLVISALARRRR